MSVPALRFSRLTRFFDRFLALTMPVPAMRRMVIDAVPPGTALVVDAGCGTGQLTLALSSAFPETQFLAFDPDPEAERIARQRLKESRNTSISRCTASEWPLPSNAGAVVLSLVLHHMDPPHRTRMLPLVARSLRPDGRLIVLDWARPARWQVLQFSITRLYDGWRRTAAFASGEIQHELEASGFSQTGQPVLLRTFSGTLSCTVWKTV